MAAAGFCAILLLAGPASAASGHIAQISSADGKLAIIFGGSDLPDGAMIDAATVQVKVGSRYLPAKAESLSTQPAATALISVVLVIDTSGSMKGDGIIGAKAAAKTFVAGVPDGVRVGLVSFAKVPSVRIAPTADKVAVNSAIDALSAVGDTALYDGLQAGLTVLGKTGSRRVLLLSDGADTGSKTTLTKVLAAAGASGATVDAVAFTAQADKATLAKIAASGRGQVYPATKAYQITRVFAKVGQDVSNQLAISVPIPADLAGQLQTVEVTARAGGDLLRDSSYVRLGSAKTTKAKAKPAAQGPQPVDLPVGPLASRTSLYVAVGALFAGLLLLLLVVLFGRSPGRNGQVHRRLSIYTLTGRNAQETQRETTALGNNAVARSAVEFAGRVVAQRNFESGLARRLEAGGVPLKPAEFLLIHMGVAVALPVLLLLLSGGSLAATLVGLLIGVGVPIGYLNFKESRRRAAFLNQLPDVLQLLAGSLSAGYSFPQAVDAVVQEGSQPMAGEFKKALVESRLGFPVEDAMEAIAARMKSKDFAWVVMAVRIQREVGGNLAEVLTTVAATLRERERIRRQVLSLSAEGKLSAAILFAMPVLFSIYLLLVRGDYIRVLYTDPIGILLLIVMAVQLTVGAFWLRKVVRVEV
ncbi:MAG: type II secretion system F family protein [Pseudonocardiales bacterium]